jgi:hypothetical protein
MTISMSALSLPVLKQMLGSLSVILGKAAEFAAQRKIDEAVLLGARLAPDMFPLSRQVQIAADMTKAGMARLAGVEPPKYEDTEASFAELQARLAKTLAFIEGLPTDAIDASVDKEIVIKLRDRELTFTGLTNLQHWVFPHTIFHVTTAYDILRHNGVELGKRDFIGSY